LHEQLEKIGDQIQNIQEDTTAVEDSFLPNSDNNTVELQKTVTELREVIKFIRSEKEIVRVQLDAARREADRDRAAAEVARQSLDSIRTEIRQIKESTESVDGNDCQLKLDNAEKRCQLLEESNAHLRDEIKNCRRKVTTLTTDLEDSKQGSIATETRQKDLEAKNAGLDSERESLRREVNDWKGRVQALVTQFNQIDPVEHQKVLKEFKKMQTEVAILERKTVEAEDESKRIRQLAGRASKELQQNKQLVEKQKKTIADLAEEKDNLTKQYKGNKMKDLEELKVKISQLEEERKNEKKLLSGANEMNEKLRERLRQFQKIINETKKREALLHNQLDQAKAKSKSNASGAKIQAGPNAIAAPPSPGGTTSVDFQQTDPKEKTDGKEIVVSLIESRVARAIPSIPVGGFMFGPSGPDRSSIQSEDEAENSVHGKKILVDPNVEENEKVQANSKKDAVQSSTQTMKTDQGSSRHPESTLNPATLSRRPSGERKEITIKEKLMQRKRKLMMDMQMKQDVLRKTQNVTQTAKQKEKQPAAKRTKVATEEHDQPPSGIIMSTKEANYSSVDITSSTVHLDSNDTDSQNETHKSLPLSSTTEQSETDGIGKGQKHIITLPADTHGNVLSEDTSPSQISKNPELKAKQLPANPALAASFGGAFLNIKPPEDSPSAPQFQFGSSKTITLPTPSVPQPANIFNAFSASKPFNGGVTTKPLFGTALQDGAIEGKDDQMKE